MSLLAPIYSAGVHLEIYSLLDEELGHEMLAWLACSGTKVRALSLCLEMNFAEFYFVKELFLQDVTDFGCGFFAVKEVIMFFMIIT